MCAAKMNPDPTTIRQNLAACLKWQLQGLPMVQIPQVQIQAPAGPSLDRSTLQQEIHACERCPLHAGRKRSVVGEGANTAKIMVVLPPPSMDDENKGTPLAGEAGDLLLKMLQAISSSYLDSLMYLKT